MNTTNISEVIEQFNNLNWKFGPVNDQYANIEEKHPIKTSNLNLTKDPPSYSTVVVKNEFKNVPVSSFEIAGAEDSYDEKVQKFSPTVPKLTTLIEELHNSPYYHNLDRKGAVRFLVSMSNLSEGDFLLRPSTDYVFILTVYKNKRFYNIPVEKDADGYFFNNVEQGMKIKFKSLESYIEYHILNGFTIRDKAGNFLHIRLKKLSINDDGYQAINIL